VKKATTLHYFDGILLALILTCWTLPVGLGLRADMGIRTALLFPFLVILVVQIILFRPQLDPNGVKYAWILILGFVGLWITALLRATRSPNELDTVYIIGYLAFLIVFTAYLVFTHARHGASEERASAIRFGALGALGLYVAANVFLHVAGFRQPYTAYLAEYPAYMLTSLGIQWNRTLFPLADGINSFGVIAGATTVMYLPILARSTDKIKRTMAAVVIATGLAAILMTDARAALILVIAFAVAGLLPEWLGRYVRWVPLAASALPVALMLIAPAVFGTLHGFERPEGQMAALERDELAAELCAGRITPQGGALSNRPQIWQTVLNEFREPDPVHLFGFGFRGQAAAGISGELSCIFLSHTNRHLAGAHNVWLQTLIEIGYIGVLVVFALTIWLIVRLSRLRHDNADPVLSGLLGGVLYLIAAGALESTLSPDYSGTFLIFLIAIFHAGLFPRTGPGA
jgi:O-antigen ligase